MAPKNAKVPCRCGGTLDTPDIRHGKEVCCGPFTEEWPKVRVEFHDPTRKPVIVSLSEAITRYGLARASAHSLRSECGTAGVGPGLSKCYRTVRTFWKYTQDDSIRDAAPVMLAALRIIAEGTKNLRQHDPNGGGVQSLGEAIHLLERVCVEASTAIAKATREV